MEMGENDLWNWPLWVEVVVEVMGLMVDNSDSEYLTPVSYTHLRAPRDQLSSRMPSSA